MIIIGYQGIGKSTTAKKFSNVIDLESGCFWYNGKRQDNWHVYYCQIAEHLSSQDKIVFVSSHKQVREYLKNSKELVIAICPSIYLRDEWIKRLEDRYNSTGLDKDYKALMNAKDCYKENILDIANDIERTHFIQSITYDLEDEVRKALGSIEV